ncbi:hypothetical protein K2173_001629 [Erythroxylum novogranatense]|uniref:Tyrosinase copper-binding domain-containing protein n=1 Tax=Erythroxylum novogranatense TaxID=1862640 RepID=A0AAV8T5G7_9ROSI|nr:hypothetical protein K2173_001629 [Erythroxylum novogranatense]
MASHFSSPFTAQTSTISTSAFCPTFPKTSQLSACRNRNRNRNIPRVSCKTGDDDDLLSLNSATRRDVLIGLGGLSGATALSDPSAFALPISSPDFTNCGAADLPTGAKPVNCCPPTATKIIDFKLPATPTQIRIRPAAHKLDGAYIAKFSKALELMKSLPDDDPRSFTQQAHVHCAYCNGAYHQEGYPDLDLQIHNSWLFFPFHRWYLYFFEKILGKLINDPTFAIPFWNWDAPAGMQMPAVYTPSGSPLYDAYRNQSHLPPTLLDLDYSSKKTPITDADKLYASNLALMYRQMVTSPKTNTLFFGHPYRAGTAADPGAGTIETTPHTQLHIWCGDPRQPNGENMGNFYSAGRDPLFFAHHSNVDRMWNIWKKLKKRNKDISDTDYLESTFAFYDENKNLVRVKVKDSLDSRKLGYDFQDVDIPWLKSKATPKKSTTKVAMAFGQTKKAFAAETKKSVTPLVAFPLVLDKVITTKVARPNKSRTSQEKEEAEEILVIKDIVVERDVPAKFDVFINDEDESQTTPDNTEFAGSFVNVPHKHKGMNTLKTCLRLGITELLEDLGADDDDEIVVTLVPRVGEGLITVGGLTTELLEDL